jgi:hypothetical protein
MKYPNKLYDYSESNISKFSVILNELKDQDFQVYDLYKLVKKHFENLPSFIETLQCLYLLDAIIYDSSKECLVYAL